MLNKIAAILLGFVGITVFVVLLNSHIRETAREAAREEIKYALNLRQ